MRVCLDTNVLVAAFATRGLCADILRTVLAEHELVIGVLIIEELKEVLKFKLQLPPDQIAAVVSVFGGYELLPKPRQISPLQISDNDDRWVHATAIEGNAEVIVTGDKAFLNASRQSPIPIVNPRQFWELLSQREKFGAS